MIKTDRVIYRTRTQEEYDWLMQELEKAGCIWREGNPPTRQKPYWKNFRSDTCIRLRNKKITYEGSDYYEYDPDEGDYEFIEVSDLMENEKKTEILDKLETMNEQLKDEFKKLKEENDESQKIKKVVYTTEVYFE